MPIPSQPSLQLVRGAPRTPWPLLTAFVVIVGTSVLATGWGSLLLAVAILLGAVPFVHLTVPKVPHLLERVAGEPGLGGEPIVEVSGYGLSSNDLWVRLGTIGDLVEARVQPDVLDELLASVPIAKSEAVEFTLDSLTCDLKPDPRAFDPNAAGDEGLPTLTLFALAYALGWLLTGHFLGAFLSLMVLLMIGTLFTPVVILAMRLPQHTLRRTIHVKRDRLTIGPLETTFKEPEGMPVPDKWGARLGVRTAGGRVTLAGNAPAVHAIHQQLERHAKTGDAAEIPVGIQDLTRRAEG